MSDATVEVLRLLAWTGAFLSLATGIAALLTWRAGGPGGNAAVDNLRARIDAWWVMVAVLGAALLMGAGAVTVLFAIISLACLREFVTLTDTRRADHWALAGAFFLVLPAHYALIWTGWYGLWSIFIPVYAFLLMPVTAVFGGDTRRFFPRVAGVQWGLMVCVFCLGHVPALMWLDIDGFDGRGALLVAFLVIVVQGSDVMQYVWGKLLGRRLIAARVSPSKTVEGFVGGVLTAMVLGAALSFLTPFSALQAAGMALVAILMGFFGGLVMSAIKRDKGVKDWGHLIAGHGGFLDRLDSLIFAAPVFFHLTRYFWGAA